MLLMNTKEFVNLYFVLKNYIYYSITTTVELETGYLNVYLGLLTKRLRETPLMMTIRMMKKIMEGTARSSQTYLKVTLT